MSASQFTIATQAANSDWRELASRETDGLAVSLLWSKSADRVKVTVADSRLDDDIRARRRRRRRAGGLLSPVRVRGRPRACASAMPRASPLDLQLQS